MIGLILIGLILFSIDSYSHEGRPVYIEVEEENVNQFTMRWKIPPVLASSMEPRIDLKGDGCELISGRMKPALTGKKQINCTGSSAEKKANDIRLGSPSVVVEYPQGNPALSTLVQITRTDGTSYSLYNGPDVTRIPLPTQLTVWDQAKKYISGGIEHILNGFDHLLFVLCLMQIAGSPRGILIAITGFTFAHSVTLAIATLGVLQINLALVDALISLSIVVLAIEIVKNRRDTLTWRYPVVIATLFGLLHGFGFAGALSGFASPQKMEVLTLAFFNIGIEAGQLFFILAVTAVIKLVQWLGGRRTVLNYTDGLLPLSIVRFVGVIGMYWFFDRSVMLISPI